MTESLQQSALVGNDSRADPLVARGYQCITNVIVHVRSSDYNVYAFGLP
jgi:hypothetical protein